MHDLHAWLRTAHIAIGSIALVLFWLPTVARKGGARHRRFGRWYANAMLLVAMSAIGLSILTLIDPIGIRYPDGIPAARSPTSVAAASRRGAWFLLMLGLLVLASVQHGRRVLTAGANRTQLRQPPHLLLVASPGVCGLWVIGVGLQAQSPLLIVFSLLSIWVSANMLWYAFKPTLSPREWWIEHLTSLIGSGIGAYTAFFAFGGTQLFRDVLTGQWMIVPWVLPSIIGSIASAQLARRYRQRLRASTTA
ncbi:MAG: hypothetical protein AAGC71_05140 [Pseudomonadota bacterium]